MNSEDIKKIADDIRREEPALRHIDLETILTKRISQSGIAPFLASLKRPAAWISGMISLWVEGFLPEEDWIKLSSGVSIGAAIDALGSYLKRRGVNPLPQQERLVWPELPPLLSEPETNDVVNNLVSGVIADIKAQGYKPPSLEDQRMQVAYRVALNNPRFKMLIV